MVLPDTIEKLIKQFSQFPGIGPKQAARFVFFLLNADPKYRDDIIKELRVLTTIQPCATCNLPSAKRLCPICSNTDRIQSQICIVENASDLLNFERAHIYQGTYYVLNATAVDTKRVNLTPLKKRIESIYKDKKSEKFEIIIATNPTAEGESTALYLEKELRAQNAKITRLARGLPSGAELEYADQTTLQNAFENRKDM